MPQSTQSEEEWRIYYGARIKHVALVRYGLLDGSLEAMFHVPNSPGVFVFIEATSWEELYNKSLAYIVSIALDLV